MKRALTVTTPDNVVHSRTTSNDYTHAVAILRAGEWQLKQFCTRRDLAEKEVRFWSQPEFKASSVVLLDVSQ